MTGFNRHEEAEVSRADIWWDDAFGTLGKYAEFLTNALVANEKPFVLNVNGDWGTGKTFFVRRWAASLRQDYPVVEYNAWENDSEDDPLTSLLAVCAEHLKTYLPDDETLISGIKKKGGRVALPPDHSLLIEVLLWEKRYDEAWMEAQSGGCSERLLLELAKHREKAHPEDAIKIYQTLVEPLVQRTNNASYQEAVSFMSKVHGLMKTLGQEAAFSDWVHALKGEYKRKRNFIKYVERRAWGK